MKKFAMALIFTLALTAAAHAANPKWQTLTFTEDKQAGLETLKGYCLVHEVTPNDVLWANHTDSEDITAGTTIYLPGRQADLLAIWQNVGAWTPKALVPVTSGAAARRLIDDEKTEQKAAPVQEVAKAEPETTPVQETAQAEQKPALVQEAAPPLITANVFPNGAPVLPVKEEPKLEAPKVEPAQEVQPETLTTQPAQDIITADLMPKAEPKTEQPEQVQTVKQPEPKQEDPIIIKAGKPAPKTKKTAKKNQQLSPAAVIAQTAKPDKILTAKPKPKSEIPGLMDPIIILSPNGDPTAGPMRLIISGDKVEVVKLPQTAAPKKPSVADINTPFTATESGWSYLPHYNMTPKPNNNFTNLNALNGKMMWPVDGKISSPFGKWRGKHKHEGIDIPMPAGTPIRAARNGVVARTGNNSTMGFRGYGNFVMLDHGGSIKTFYAHCSSVAVVEGQRVMQGQIIGYVGSTGRSTANHLHFEVRVNDSKVNPVPYLAGNTQFASHK